MIVIGSDRLEKGAAYLKATESSVGVYMYFELALPVILCTRKTFIFTDGKMVVKLDKARYKCIDQPNFGIKWDKQLVIYNDGTTIVESSRRWKPSIGSQGVLFHYNYVHRGDF